MTLMAVQIKMQDAIQGGADTEVSDEEAAQKSMQYVFFSYTSTDEEGKSVDMTDEEKDEAKKKAETFAKEVKEAEDFEAFAKEKEMEAKTATFDAESTSPAEDLIKAADKLEEGEVTDLIETDRGCYVAKVNSLLDREATDAEKENIVNERKQKLYEDTCEKLRKDAKIEVNNEVWEKISFKDIKVTIKQVEQDPYANEVQTDDVADAEEDKDTEEDSDSQEEEDSDKEEDSEEDAQ